MNHHVTNSRAVPPTISRRRAGAPTDDVGQSGRGEEHRGSGFYSGWWSILNGNFVNRMPLHSSDHEHDNSSGKQSFTQSVTLYIYIIHISINLGVYMGLLWIWSLTCYTQLLVEGRRNHCSTRWLKHGMAWNGVVVEAGMQQRTAGCMGTLIELVLI